MANDMNEEWESTKGPDKYWNPTKDAEGNFKPVGTAGTEDDIIDGYYVDVKYGVGENNATLYTIQTNTGEKFGVWGSKALNDEMEKIRIGQYIRIKWLGKFLTKDGAKKPAAQRGSKDSFHSYEVFQSKTVAPMNVLAKNTPAPSNSPESAASNATASATSNGGQGIPKKETYTPSSQDEDLPF